jgi:hypothetical protein
MPPRRAAAAAAVAREMPPNACRCADGAADAPIFRFVLLPLMIVYCRFRAAAMPYAAIDFSAFMPLFFADAAAMPPAYACLPLLRCHDADAALRCHAIITPPSPLSYYAAAEVIFAFSAIITLFIFRFAERRH